MYHFDNHTLPGGTETLENRLTISHKAKHMFILRSYTIHMYLPKELKTMFTKNLYGCLLVTIFLIMKNGIQFKCSSSAKWINCGVTLQLNTTGQEK